MEGWPKYTAAVVVILTAGVLGVGFASIVFEAARRARFLWDARRTRGRAR
jgi:hypothetical protein